MNSSRDPGPSIHLNPIIENEKWMSKTYKIAVELDRKNLWPGYIKHEFMTFLKKALTSLEAWKDFMNFSKDGWEMYDSSNCSSFEEPIQSLQKHLASPIHQNIPNRLEIIPSNSSDFNSVTPVYLENSKKIKAEQFSRILAATYVRAIIFEQYVSLIYPFNCDFCEPLVPTNLLEDKILELPEINKISRDKSPPDLSKSFLKNPFGDFNSAENESEENSESGSNFGLNDSSRKIEEFDDFDEDVTSPKNGTNTVAEETIEHDFFTNQPSNPKKIENSVNITTEWFSSVDTKTSTNEPDPSKADFSDATITDLSSSTKVVNLYDRSNSTTQNSDLNTNHKIQVPAGFIYHTLENDLNSIPELQKFESDRIAIKESISRKLQRLKSDSVANQVSSIPNVKNLAAYIDSNRDQVNLSSSELAVLLSEVRPKKTKWSSDEVPGQEELYSSLEHVLSEVKNMGQISLPFCSQVKRRDAPDYYDVISNPMDLGTMTKRLKNLFYRSKKEFEDDIKLIRDNCYQYNTAPSHPYRKQADIIVKKVEQLLSKVTDHKIMENIAFDNDEELNTEFGDDSDGGTVNDFGNPISKSNYIASPDITENSPNPNIGTNIIQSSTDKKPDLDNTDRTNINFSKPTNGITHINLHDADTVRYHNKSPVPESQDFFVDYNTKIKAQRICELVSKKLDESEKHFFNDSEVWERTSKNYRSQNALDSIKRSKTLFPNQLALVRSQFGMNDSILESHSKIEDFESPYSSQNGIFFSKIKYSKNDLDSDPAIEDSNISTLPQSQLVTFNETLKSQKITLQLMEDVKSNLELNSRLGYSSTYQTLSGIPDFGANCQKKLINLDSNNYMLNGSNPPKRISYYKSARFPRNRMFNSVTNTIDSLGRIRKIDNKISVIKFNISVGYYEGNYNLESQNSGLENDFELDLETEKFSLLDKFDADVSSPESQTELSNPRLKNNCINPSSSRRRLDFNSEDPKEKYVSTKELIGSDKLHLDKATGAQLMNRTCGLILAHSGFEKLTKQALSLVSEVVIQYISNLGETLRVYTDSHSKNMSSEAILAHTLHENGVESLDDLKFYCDEHIVKMELRISDTEKKLMRSYQELVSGASNNQTDELMELNNEDSLVNGELSAVGDDFFGFKELGLDKEFGIDVNKGIPTELWFGKTRNKFNPVSGGLSIHDLKYIPPPLWKQVSDLDCQVGLFIPFLVGKFPSLPKFPDQSVIEQTEDSNNKNIPPTQPNEDSGQIKDPYIVIKEYLDDNSGLISNLEPLVEDEILPIKSRYGYGTRPKVPPANNLKKKTLINNSLNSNGNSKTPLNTQKATSTNSQASSMSKPSDDVTKSLLEKSDNKLADSQSSVLESKKIFEEKSDNLSTTLLVSGTSSVPTVTNNKIQKDTNHAKLISSPNKKAKITSSKSTAIPKRKLEDENSTGELLKKKRKVENILDSKNKINGDKDIQSPNIAKKTKKRKGAN
ncbi:Transcriptional activator spt7 [Smittium mucronatum]|uniref:Transcriptional activator spt7 n=1 Tax=Smittium mucronatum TaxID=133383 RepID=A0A1R0GUC6_9FUNG|nr:Transcriptional activator spt7 [Smittium mucronatum]